MKYQEMLPHQIDEELVKAPIAYIPWGALEWHGKHLAIGNDAVKADALCNLIAERTGGVVVPPIFVGYQTMQLYGFPHTLEFSEELVKRLAMEFFQQIEKVGFKVCVVITGHYGKKHVAALKAVAEQFAKLGKMKVWVLPEYEVVEDLGYSGDHAGKWETSILMHLLPELVDMSQQPADLSEPLWGVGGEDPRVHASAELGKQIVEAMVDRIAQRALELLREAG